MTFTPWHRTTPMLAFDTETTGINVETDRIVTCTLIHIAPGQAPQPRSWLINPGTPIPDSAAAIHGITTEHAQQHGQAPATALDEIAHTIAAAIAAGHPIVAFNAAYDFTILDRELARHSVPGTTGMLHDALAVDPSVIDKHLDRYRKGSRKLVDVARHYGLREFAAHDATADALTAARLAWVMAQGYPAELQRPLPELHALQQEWKARQAQGLRRHFLKTGKDASSVHDAWPIHPTPDPATENAA